MRRSTSTATPGKKESGFEHDSDRYPNLNTVLQKLVGDGLLPEDPIEWLEVHLQPSGEVTYRWRRSRADDWDGGYLDPATFA
jgi:hypothetical protein